MPSRYLSGSDLTTYGVAAATDQQILQASQLVDSYLKRPEGMVWAPGYDNAPAYMAAATPTWSGTLAAAILPGINVVVSSGLAFMGDLVGDVVVLDRGLSNACEAVSISASDPIAGTVTLRQVRQAHSANATIELGLTIAEERSLPGRRSLTRIARPQFARMLGGAGRYGYGRRSDASRGYGNDFGLLAMAQSFGSTPIWEGLDVTQMSVSPTTGEVWIPSGLLLAYFSDVKLRYVAGYASTALPAAIKQATASLITNIVSSVQDIGTQIKVLQAGGSRMERFSESNLDPDVMAALQPYRARTLA